MLIGLISDTHNKVARTYRALRTFQKLGVKAILHCGDLTRPQMNLNSTSKPWAELI
jgi:uncharacterized protein